MMFKMTFYLFILAVLTFAQEKNAILLGLDKEQRFFFNADADSSIQMDKESYALVVWRQGDLEGIQYLKPSEEWTMPAWDSQSSSNPSWNHLSRGQSSDKNTGIPQLTHPMTQLTSLGAYRSIGSFIIPSNASILMNGKPNFYRKQENGQMPAFVVLLKGIRIPISLRIPFPENQHKVLFHEIPDLPDRFKSGLPEGEYSLQIEGDRNTIRFFLHQEQEDSFLRKARLLFAEGNNPLYIQLAVEHLLSHKDKKGKLAPYFCDAFDILDSLPEESLTPYLGKMKKGIYQQLTTSSEQDKLWVKPTGIALIDKIRQDVILYKWKDAMLKLEEGKTLLAQGRARYLGQIYKAILLAESAIGKEEEIDSLLGEAIQDIPDSLSEDKFLAHNNYANILFKRSQDRLYNHAFQMATGSKLPLFKAFRDWIYAHDHYEKALGYCQEIEDEFALKANLVRLYALLNDIVRTFGNPQHPGHHALLKASYKKSCDLSDSILANINYKQIQPFLHGTVWEIKARLALRNQEDQCIQFAQEALKNYITSGSLPGAESVHRLIGLYYANSKDIDRKKALHHCKISHLISEVLRDQIPQDNIGLGYASFFASRAHVNENIIDLLIAEGQDEEALQYAEWAKAQAFQNLIVTSSVSAVSSSYKVRNIKQILSAWPKDIALLEYFIGSHNAYAFFVDTKGKVTAYPLSLKSKSDFSLHLVVEINSFLNEIDHSAAKILRRLRSGKGMDHSWQDKLHSFYQKLIPSAILGELRKAKTLILVPHHILHYFPFAALVVEKDNRKLGKWEMAKPQFFLEEPFSLCSSPSITAWDILRQRTLKPIHDISALAISDFPVAPLPGVEKDVQNLKEVFGSQVKQICMNEQGNKDNAQGLLKNPGLLLFATHGKNNPDSPLDSHLLLYSTNEETIHLSAREIFQHRIYTDMIVMSACYSGLADRSPMPGDDLFGLSRAFLQSGTRSIVSGLWDVYDATGPILMKDFFISLSHAKTAPHALADAQRQFISRLRSSKGFEPWLHPYFWAVYTILGDDRVYIGEK
ncbi:MAG: CHAT domain-containing protein [Candidatus Brocadiae bacterium]|nr:CHAT domain-containing protein [Candidatus Brocadiia bacterium]